MQYLDLNCTFSNEPSTIVLLNNNILFLRFFLFLYNYLFLLYYNIGDYMKENVNVLDEIHKGSCMGIDAINFILDRIESIDLKNELYSEIREYEKINKKIVDLYSNYANGNPQSESTMNKVMAWSGIEMKTITDKSDSKYVELLLTGVNMGIIEGKKILNNKKIDKNIVSIVKEFIMIQEKNYDNLKKYL